MTMIHFSTDRSDYLAVVDDAPVALVVCLEGTHAGRAFVAPANEVKPVEGERLVTSVLMTTTVRRVLTIVGLSLDERRLPMVTDRCMACGESVDLVRGDYQTVRFNGNSNYGYEPYCRSCQETCWTRLS